MVTRDVCDLAPARWDLQEQDQEQEDLDQIPREEALTHIIEANNTAHRFGPISVAESSEIHFGNKTFIHGPVTIKQFITNVDSAPESHYQNPVFSADEKIDNVDKQEKCEKQEQNEHLNNGNGDKPNKDVVFNVTQQVPPHFNFSYRDILRNKCLTTKKVMYIAGTVISVFSLMAIIYLIKSLNVEANSKSTDTKPNDENLIKNIPIETDIDKVLLLSKSLRMVSRSEWLAQPPSGVLDNLTTPAPFVIITHTATESCKNQAECTFRVRIMQTFHIESRQWFDIGYNFAIGGDGSAYECRGWDKMGAHTRGYNDKSIGIALIGTFNTELPHERQLLATKQLIELGVALGKISKDYKLFGHRQLIPSLSPGDALFENIKKWPHFENTNSSQIQR